MEKLTLHNLRKRRAFLRMNLTGCGKIPTNQVSAMASSFTLDSIPYAPRDVVIKDTGNVYLFLDPDTPNWMIVNTVGRDVLTLCNGARSVREIVRTLCDRYREPYEESVDSVLAFVNEAKKNRFLQEEPFPCPLRLDKAKLPLHTLWINVTNKCNLRCMHCHLSSGAPLESEMTTEEILGIISTAKDMGVKDLVVSGGEPLIRNDILSILECASHYVDRVNMVTNGTLITDEIARRLSELDIEVQVSLDGARKETHEFVRGKNTYRKTVEGIKSLVDAGVHACIGMTVMKHNIGEMEEMAQLAETVGITVLHITTLQNKGRAQENQPRIGLDDRDFVTIIEKMKEISEQSTIRIDTEEGLRAKVERLFEVDLCGAGSAIVSIAADGNVYPCAGLHEKEFCAGNIREQSLSSVWETSDIFKKLRSLSVLDIETCRRCELKFICGGGCHVDKYHVYKRLDVPSVRCKAEKEAYWYLISEKMKEVAKNL